ncbi:MAG: S8 family serine peptidase [Acidobacteria bacterium]|nr:S8 family serine peptidase [Acidobacteriota bacterium]
MRNAFRPTLVLFGILLLGPAAGLASPTVDSVLAEQVASNPSGQTPAIITYNHQPTSDDLAGLQLLSISAGIVLNRLPMVLTTVNQGQLDALRSRSGILSLYANEFMERYTNVSRTFIGVTSVRKDAEVTRRNGGLPVSGKGIGVAVVDTGIDATHPDLQLGRNVVQNVLFPLTELSVTPTGCALRLSFNFGFLPPTFLENQPISDAEGGHGTFVSGVIGGTGQSSGGFFGGVAPGADLIGVVAGNDCGLPSFGILQAFDYVMVNQIRYRIRVVNNSWGSNLGTASFDPDHPINVATRHLHDLNITVVFAAGNSGDNPGAINRYSVAPWVISVAAGDREALGRPAGFSSRGQDNGTGTDTAGQPASPSAPPNLRPDITAPGANIKSTRSKGPGITNTAGTVPLVGNDLLTIAPAFLPFYTTSQGTSFSAPHASGVVALMLEANPLLTPDEVVTLLRATATPMPFEERVVGAGFVDAHNAVRAAMGLEAVSHPADLSLADPEVVDPPNDQTATTAQDIRQGDFSYDAATNQIVYKLTVTDLSARTTHMRWTMSSRFGDVTVFVAANTTETGEVTFQYGRIAINPDTGLRQQTTLGTPDSGELVGNQIIIRLGLDKVNAAVGSDVLFITSTGTVADAWTRIGSTLTPSLLLNSDSGGGTDFRVGEPDDDDPPPPPVDPFCERFAGMMAPDDVSVEVAVKVRLPFLDAKLNFHPGNQDVLFQLFDSNGVLMGTADGSNRKRIRAGNLEPGDYIFRLSATPTKAIDFVISSCQSSTED